MMKNDGWNKSGLALGSVIGVIAFVGACGIDEGARYADKALLEGPRPIEERRSSADAERNDADQPPIGADDEFLDDDGLPDEEPIDPATLVVNSFFRARFDPESALRLVDNEEPTADLSFAESTVQEKLGLTTPSDGVLVQQTYGDGVSRSEGRQQIKNTPGDQDVDLKEGETSASGVQTYVRVTDDAQCDSIFVCIPKLSFTPEVGAPKTVCFQDQSGSKNLAIPFATVPGYEFKVYQKQFGSLGPYRAVRYPAADVDCDNPSVAADHFEEFVIKFSGALLASDELERYFQDPAAFEADQMLMFEFERVVNDNVAPFLDETVNLQKRSRTFIDSKERAMVKFIKTVRSTVRLNFFQDLLFDMNGLMVDLHFELCEDRLKQEGGRYCD